MSAPAPDPATGPGPLEVALTADLDGLIGEPPWKGTLAAMLLANARVLDQVAEHGRYDILSGMQMRMLDMMDRLRKVSDAGAKAPADLSALLGVPD